MKITYLGHSCFCIESDNGTRLLTDPYTGVGYELPSGLTADILLVSHGHFDHNHMEAIGGNPLILTESGKYSACGIDIEGFDSWHDSKQGALRGKNVIFTFIVDGVRFCHFGDLGEDYCENIAKKVSKADVWLIPVGGTYTIDAAQAREYMKKLSPKIVIPMHYLPDDGGLDIAKIDDFLCKIDKNSVITCKNGEYILDKSRLNVLSGKIIYMERRK